MRPGSLADFLALAGIFCRIIRCMLCVNLSGAPLACLKISPVKVGFEFLVWAVPLI